ncbi:hypothetical protein [Azospirillum sp. TSH100]|uniref:hypothetical protein n=1 Tax=Azospirillum sp. TSH100 TaxID=652764 RepID=UPI001304A6BB|nr:hypothetical protein [Azospirillum sp. TSH100]
MIRGAFLNTEPAVCSIFESGKMVYDCLKQSKFYDLDYITLEQIDIDYLKTNQSFRLKAGHEDAEGEKPGSYDFWVLNYHPHTMAPLLPQELLPHLKGPKFAIVLEVEPDNPIKFVPAERFDSCIVLDPTAMPTAKVTPFPRPLRGVSRKGHHHNREIPVIGSFGLGTPGKGFEHVVEAVNREFDRAIVRINVPRATHVDSIMFNVHRMEYSEYIEKLCRKIAKPGIEIQFTRDFLEEEELVDWCADNDLNCFFYTRRQSGLSATTDQCVISGQPLIVSSNDTFRHIHPYIAPYPKTSLRDAMRSTRDSVRRLQKDWSVAAFQDSFIDMLVANGVTVDGRGDAEAARSARHSPTTVVLAMAGTGEEKAPLSGPISDPISYVQRVVAALGRTGEYKPVIMRYRDADDFQRGIFWLRPSAVVLCGTVEDPGLPPVLEQAGPVLHHLPLAPGQPLLAEGLQAPALQQKVHKIDRAPVIPYYTALPSIPPGPMRICVFGARTPDNSFELIVSKIQRDKPDAQILVARLPSETEEDDRLFARKLEAMQPQLRMTPALQVVTVPMPRDAFSVIHTVGTYDLLLFANDGTHGPELLDYCDLALSTERAVIFTRMASFPEIQNGTFLEDAPVEALARKGMSAQTALYNLRSEGRLYSEFDRVQRANAAPTPAGQLQSGWLPSGSVVEARSFPCPSGLLEAEESAWLAKGNRLDILQDSDLSWAHEHAAAYVTPQQQFLVAAVECLSNWSPASRIVAFGDESRGSGILLRKLGYTLTSAEERMIPAGSADCVFSSCALSGMADARDFLTRVVAMLKPGGSGVFTFFQREAYADDDQENPDFPTTDPDELLALLESLGVTPVGPVQWHSQRPLLAPNPFSAPQLAGLVFLKPEAATP